MADSNSGSGKYVLFCFTLLCLPVFILRLSIAPSRITRNTYGFRVSEVILNSKRPEV
jgi:hypothetical protein